MGKITPSEEIEETLHRSIEERNWPKVNEITEGTHPHDLWEFIEGLNEDVQHEVLSNLERGILIELLPELPDERQVEFIEILSPKSAAELLIKIPPDERIDVLKNLPLDAKREVLKHFTTEEREEAGILLKHPSDTAGGIMTTELVHQSADSTIKETIDYIREKARDFETIYYVYVVDNERLVGVLSLRELVIASADDRLKDIMNPDVIKVHANTDQEAVARITADYDLTVVPVVDENDKLLGIVTVDDVLDVIEEEVVEDMGHLAGTGEKLDKLIDAPILTVVKARLPWLIFALFGGLISAYVLKLFETTLTLSAFIMLALFIPAIMALGGNVGVQSSTIFIRGLATGDIEKPIRYFLRELKIGFIMGILISTGIAIVAQLVVQMPTIGIIVGTSMFFAMTLASATGILIPVFFSRVGVDPAISSSPLITTTQDILSLAVYFSLATAMLHYLGP
ncbi:MAG: magnesium transporter [Candidatus Hydrothermarchaeaceae archaeon]